MPVANLLVENHGRPLSSPVLSTSTCTFTDDKDSWRAVSFPPVGSACSP
jgi:hypothetical protein